MFGNLLNKAQADSIVYCEIDLLVEKNQKVLLLEKAPIAGQGFYELPMGSIKEGETLQQAIQRILIETIGLSLKKVVRFLTHKDFLKNEKTRTFYFVVEVNDPEDINPNKYHSFGWVEPEEAVGYPIKEDLREILDLHMKIKQQQL